MRVLKDDKYEAILHAARGEFMLKGYKGASMRNIARRAGVGLSNVYNYFKGKDELYVAVVGPVKDELFAFITRQHAEDNVDFIQLTTFGHCEEAIDDYISMIERYREELRLLLFCSEGSSMSGFRDAFADHIAHVSYDYMSLERKYYPNMKNVSAFFIHAMASWTVNVVGEIIANDLDRPHTREFFREYFRFEFAGWRELTGNG